MQYFCSPFCFFTNKWKLMLQFSCVVLLPATVDTFCKHMSKCDLIGIGVCVSSCASLHFCVCIIVCTNADLCTHVKIWIVNLSHKYTATRQVVVLHNTQDSLYQQHQWNTCLMSWFLFYCRIQISIYSNNFYKLYNLLLLSISEPWTAWKTSLCPVPPLHPAWWQRDLNNPALTSTPVYLSPSRRVCGNYGVSTPLYFLFLCSSFSHKPLGTVNN